MRRDLRVALETITEATERYPERIAAWNYRSAVERQALGASAYDSLRAEHLSRLQAFHDSLSQLPLEPETAASMVNYAIDWGVWEMANWWSERVAREEPLSAAAAQLRALEIVSSDTLDAAGVLHALEALWADVDLHQTTLAQRAYEFARDLKHASAMSQWAGRWLELEPWWRLDVIEDMIALPALHDAALAWLAREDERLRTPHPARRPLYLSAAAQRREDQRARRELLGLEGRILLARGEADSGLALIESATARGWDVALFRDAADARLAAGDVLGAVEMLARLEADPGHDDPGVAARGLALVADSEWDTAVRRATEHVIEETRREADPRSLPDSLRVTEPNGIARDLRDLCGGQVSVVAFFWPACRTCLADLHVLEQLTQLARPVSVVLVSRSAVLPADLDLLRSEGISLPVVVDASRQLTAAFDSWGTPDYFVLDDRGVIRFSHATLSDIPRQILTLSESEPPIT
jgi:hypothetical protein